MSREPAPNAGSATSEKRTAPKTVRTGASQATGLVQLRRTPTAAISQSRASRQVTISRTWIAPAAWRNVPQVVETGKTRVVIVNVSALNTTSGRMA